MILLNLLPHRETARKKKREQFYATVALAALAGLGVAVLTYSWFQSAISGQRSVNTVLDTEIKDLDQKIKEIKGLEEQIEALQAKQRAVEGIQSDRNQPVYLLSELVRQLPQGVLLSKLVQTNQTVVISGSSQTNDQVSELLRNLGAKSPWLTKPELIETVAATINLSPKEQRPVFNFSIRATLTRNAAVANAPVNTTSSPVAASSSADAVKPLPKS